MRLAWLFRVLHWAIFRIRLSAKLRLESDDDNDGDELRAFGQLRFILLSLKC